MSQSFSLSLSLSLFSLCPNIIGCIVTVESESESVSECYVVLMCS